MEAEILKDEAPDMVVQIRDRLRVGDRLMYVIRDDDPCAPKSRTVRVPCRIVGKYPRLVEVAGESLKGLPVRTVTYAEMLTDPWILGRKGDKDV